MNKKEWQQLRARNEWTTLDLARIFQVDRATIKRWFAGSRRLPRAVEIVLIEADAGHVNLEDYAP